MTILVTGARGFIGRHLAAALARDGETVAGIGRAAWPDAAAAGVAHWHAGTIDAAGLDAVAAAAGPITAVYHLAGGASVAPSLAAPDTDFENSVVTTARLVEWLRVAAPAAGIVLVSSAAVYGDCGDPRIAETATIRPLSPYGTHKAMAEQLIASRSHSFGLRSAIVRLFSVYGPGLTKQLLWDVCTRCAAGPAVGVGGTGAEQRDWIHVDDAVALLRLAAAGVAPSAPVWNGGTGKATAVREAVGLVCAAWGEGRHAVFDGHERTGNPASLVADMTRAHAGGFDARIDVATGIAGYVAWFRRQ